MQMGQNPELRYWKTTWIDEVSDELWKRRIRLETHGINEARCTKIKTAMEHAMQHVEQF